jgi:hypothetical protein
MNHPPTKPTAPASAHSARWSLEVVRGRDLGRSYVLEPGETIMGNGKNGERGLDLLDQEGSSPRKMAARHASLSSTGGELTIRDLETPGGTFVNQQRLLSSQARRLESGDVIQLGSVQLKVKQADAAAASAPTPASTAGAKAPVTKPAVAAATPMAPAKAPVAAPAKAPIPATSRGPDAAPANPPAAAPAKAAAAAAAQPPVPAPARAPVPAAAAATLPPAAGRLASPFAMAGGAQCRTWDDFLVLAAQRWQTLRDEMTSGRLAEYLRRIHRPDLVPYAGSNRSPDDQLDEWLARIPTTQSSAPELDVHPETLLVQSKTGGGVARQSLRVTNVGYRLLRCTARVEPPETRWARLRPEHDGQPFLTIEQTELPVELELPETIDRPLRALIVIESNGGTRRIEVRIERPVDEVVIPDAASGAAVSGTPAWARRLGQRVARLRPEVRIAAGFAVAVALRLLVILMNALPMGVAGASRFDPRLSSFAIVLVAVGVLAGLTLALRGGEWRDLPAAGFAGGALGLLTAAVWFAAVQSFERVLGSWSTSIWALVFLWGAIGALLALVSTVLIPHRLDDREVAR